MDAAALLEMHQVRRGVNAGAVTRLLRHRLQHGAGGAFAVGARHGDHRAVKLQLQAVCHFAHPLQAHVDIEGVQALAMGQPAVQRLGKRGSRGIHRGRNCRPACDRG